MTQTAIRLKTRTLSGKRLEVTVPELDEGEEVELIVLRSEPSPTSETRPALLDFVKTVPPGPRPFATWEEYERALEEEKDAWER